MAAHTFNYRVNLEEYSEFSQKAIAGLGCNLGQSLTRYHGLIRPGDHGSDLQDRGVPSEDKKFAALLVYNAFTLLIIWK